MHEMESKLCEKGFIYCKIVVPIFLYFTITTGDRVAIMLVLFQGKKKRRGSLLALGTGAGDVLGLDTTMGQLRWRANDCHQGCVCVHSSSWLHLLIPKLLLKKRNSAFSRKRHPEKTCGPKFFLSSSKKIHQIMMNICTNFCIIKLFNAKEWPDFAKKYAIF